MGWLDEGEVGGGESWGDEGQNHCFLFDKSEESVEGLVG